MEAPDIRSLSMSASVEFSCPCGANILLALPKGIRSKKCASCGRVYLLQLQVLVDEDTLPAESWTLNRSFGSTFKM